MAVEVKEVDTDIKYFSNTDNTPSEVVYPNSVLEAVHYAGVTFPHPIEVQAKNLARISGIAEHELTTLFYCLLRTQTPLPQGEQTTQEDLSAPTPKYWQMSDQVIYAKALLLTNRMEDHAVFVSQFPIFSTEKI